jgi:murein tripeptide amidase MpaA
VLGFVPGDDRKLASWDQVLNYFTTLSQASDRVKFETLGKSIMGKPFVMATISAPENLARLDEYKRVQELLADPRKLGRGGSPTVRDGVSVRDRKAAELIKRGKTIVLITCGIHSTEVGSYLSSMLIAHRLASSNEPEVRNILKNTIILLVPSLNPDGVDIVKNWYDKTLGTPYEGTEPPELYHKYTGHDNNRDWYAFTQVETQITVDKIHNVWHPQIVHDIHQQGEYGARLFLPPYMQPVEPNVPKQIVAGYTELGSFIAREMRTANFTGITTNSTYDAWSPARAYSHYHGGVRILSETASCKIATPITVKFSELKKDEGYNPKKESATFGPLWRGGEWHLRDITNYMTTAAFLLLRHASENREGWLSRFYEIGKDAVRPRRRGELFGYLFPGESYAHQTLYVDRASGEIRSRSNELGDGTQKDSEFNRERLLGNLRRGGVEIDQVTRVRADGIALTEHPMMVRLNQPYGSFAKALLESQSYPNLRDTEGHPQQPYDVTAHSLALLMGVKVIPVNAPLHYHYDVQYMGFAVDGDEEQKTRLAVYKSHVPAIDEGWTRWTLEHVPLELTSQKFPMIGSFGFTSLFDGELRAGQLYAKYQQIIIPDQNPAAILNGYKTGAMPPEYTGGIGPAGVKALREFVEQGGTLVCLNRASTFAIDQFKLPVRDVVGNLSEKEFFVPGSILRIELDTTSPLAQGMPKETIAWVEDSPVFEVVDRGSSPTVREGSAGEMFASNVRIIARYPNDKNPLLAGWLLGESRIRGKAALVEVTMGKGRIILFGFRPQYRGQSLATYPLFFNAISGK